MRRVSLARKVDTMRNSGRSPVREVHVRDTADLELIEELAVAEARENFWAFRQYINPRIKTGWWQEEVAYELQNFYEAFEMGLRPTLVLMAPPQHGKTTQVSDFIAWVAGKNPELKSIFTSYSDNLGIGVNLYLQRVYDNPRYKRVFPGTALSQGNVVGGGGKALRNSSIIEYVDRGGSFRNTTIDGQINGQGLDMGLIDDPIKGRSEAQSKTIRDKTWSWLTDDFFGRFSEFACLLMIMTRWHMDDPAGRWIERFPKTRILRYAAIAEKDERYRKKGEALFPEHKSLTFLLKRKALLTQASWSSLYQQSPIVVGGEMFPTEKVKIIPVAPTPRDVRRSVRYWDKAGTKDGGAQTAGVLMHELKEGGFVVSDVRVGQWGALERETRIKQTAEMDEATWGRIKVWVEQEPGSGGKESAERTIANLAGFSVEADKVTGSKETRAEPYASQVQAGNVAIVKAEWNRNYLDEHETFPNGKFKDQVDAASGAFIKLVGKSGNYDSSFGWV